jgi:hypothetical protein
MGAFEPLHPSVFILKSATFLDWPLAAMTIQTCLSRQRELSSSLHLPDVRPNAVHAALLLRPVGARNTSRAVNLEAGGTAGFVWLFHQWQSRHKRAARRPLQILRFFFFLRR